MDQTARPGHRVLVVDDEPAIRRLLRVVLGSAGYQVVEAVTGRDAVQVAATARPDVIILDLGLPDMEGTDAIKEVRGWSQVPILVLSVRGQEDDKVAALDAGADDYLTKPFGSGELLARIGVALRHALAPQGEPIFTSGDLIVDLGKRLVTVAGRELRLSPIEYDLLKALVLNAGKVLTHRQLLHRVWGTGYEEERYLLRVTMSNLRRKIEPSPAQPQYIITEPGVGYRLREHH
jgi:two-component system KDP operon response regulator KdpE